MSSKNKTTATKEEATPALVPKLRFPEFREAKVWESGKIDDLVDTVTPPKKLPTAVYASSGTFPIIDQSQSDICGWTDDNEALIQEGLPLIVFGDHTCILKLIDRPFAQGADGIKILKTRPKIGTPYLYQFLNYRPVTTEEYKRHYSILKEKVVFFPEIKSGEQQKIAECLSSVDELLTAQARKVDALKTHKKGLMQQLFPREGETQPRLRFPEFQNAGEWEEQPLKKVFSIFQGFAFSSGDSVEQGCRWLKIADVGIQVMNHDAPSFLPEAYQERFSKFAVRAGDYVVALTRPILSGQLKIAKVDDVFDGALLNQRVGKLITSQHPAFVFLLLQTKKLIGDIERSISGNDPPNLSAQQIEGIKTYVPRPAEQQRIADCLTSLDALIAAEAQKLEALKTHKKGLMQQLFPSPEEVEA